MWFYRMDDFNEVETRYNRTKPVISNLHTKEQDVRPIGDRRRKWERIIKLDDNTYVLSHGGVNDPIFNWGYRADLKDHPLTKKEMMDTAPVLWRRHKDGSETITVRNGHGDYQHNARYSFLQRALPIRLDFVQTRVGVQYIRAQGLGQYYLKKTKTVPRFYVEHHKARLAKSPKDHWARRILNRVVLKNDGFGLTFRREKIGEGNWVIVGKAPAQEIVHTTVNKTAKAELKSHINKLWDWTVTMYPMMRDSVANYDARKSVNETVHEWIKTNNPQCSLPSLWWKPFEGVDSKLSVAVLKDENHPMRFALGSGAMEAIHREDNPRASFNRWVNIQFGLLNKTIKVKE